MNWTQIKYECERFLIKAKHGQLNFKSISVGGLITSVILVVVLLQVVSNTAPEIVKAGELVANTTDSTGATLPFGSLFGTGGIIILAFMATVLLGVLSSLGILSTGKR